MQYVHTMPRQFKSTILLIHLKVQCHESSFCFLPVFFSTSLLSIHPSYFSVRTPLVLLASNEVVAASTSVGDDGVEVAIGVEDDTVGTRAATSVDVEAVQDGELVPGARGRETEALVVVVLVRVGVWES